MAKYVAIDWDEYGNPIDGYYEEDAGTDYSNEGREDALSVNEYGQWLDADGNWVRDATDAEITAQNQVAPVGNVTDDNQSEAETRRLAEMNAGERGLGNLTPGNAVAEESSWSNIAKQLGIVTADNKYDLGRILALTGVGAGIIGSATATPQVQRSITELKAGMPAQSAMNATGWTPEELAHGTRPMQTGSALQRVYAADMQSPVTPGKTNKQYAEGGEIEIEVNTPGALTQAFAGGVNGEDSGQSDLISIQVSPGEYVMDAESVSALGDGNTQAGIAKLDELRQKLRAEKRAAPVDEIPPQSSGPLSYMQGA